MIAVLFLIAGFNTYAQDKKVEKKETKKEMKMDHTKHDKQVKQEKSAATAWNKVCPVKGGEVDNETPTVEYNGKAYGFCCPGCDSKFEKDPEKYSKNLNEDGTEFKKK